MSDIYWSNGWDNLLDVIPDHVQHLYVLMLNPMRGIIEEQRMIAACEELLPLQNILTEERVEPYVYQATSSFTQQTQDFTKVFRKGGKLEWFNPPRVESGADIYGNGIIELDKSGWRRIG